MQGRQRPDPFLDGGGLHQQNLSIQGPGPRELLMPLLAASSFPQAEALSVWSPSLIRMPVRP